MVRSATLLFVLSATSCCWARAAEFRRILPVTMADPVKLIVDLSGGDLEVAYSRDGQVAISALAEGAEDAALNEDYFSKSLRVEQKGNDITIRHGASVPLNTIKARYRIDVPYRTEVTTLDNHGKQTVQGVLGPVEISSVHGDVSVSYVPKAVKVRVESGDIELQMIGEHVSAHTGSGSIKGERLAKGISAETGEGDISLMMIGESEAIVKQGSGRIEIGGARERVVGSTDGGDVHVKAVPQNNWKLNSRTGTIRLELPARAGFELDASTESGKLQIGRDDLLRPAVDARQVQQKINGGGAKIEAHTENGAIVIR